jgi:hypothetical protein
MVDALREHQLNKLVLTAYDLLSGDKRDQHQAQQ